MLIMEVFVCLKLFSCILQIFATLEIEFFKKYGLSNTAASEKKTYIYQFRKAYFEIINVDSQSNKDLASHPPFHNIVLPSHHKDISPSTLNIASFGLVFLLLFSSYHICFLGVGQGSYREKKEQS